MHLVFFLGVLPPLPLDFGPARGAGVPLGICLSRAGSLLLLLLLREVEARGLLSCCRRPFPASPSLLTLPNSHRTFHDVRIRGCLQSLASAFYPPASHALRGVDRGRIGGLVHVRVALVDVALALAPLAVRGQAVVSVGGGRRPRHALLVVAHAVSGRGLLTATALGVEALGRVVTGLDPRIGIGHAVTALGVSGRGLLTATTPAVSGRVPLPVGGSGAVVRDRALSRIARVTARGQACDYLLLLPACGPRKRDGWPDVDPRRVWRRLPLSLLWPGAAAGVPPVAGGASITALPSVLRELAKFFMNLSGSSSLGATGGLAGVTASAAASGGIACPASTAAGAATIRAATVTPAGAGVLPAVPGVSGEQRRQGESRSRGRRSRSSGDGTDRRAKSAPEEGLLLLTALRVVGGGAVALPQIRLRMTELTLLLPVPGMRLEVRVLVALPGILTARLVLGRRGLLQGMSLAGLERVVVRLDLRVWRMMTAPLPLRGFDWREVAWVAFPSPLASSRRSGSSPVLLVSRFWAGFFHPLLGAPLLGRLSVVPAAGLTAVSLACGLALAVFRAVAGCHEGIDGPFFLAFGRRERLLLIYPGLF